MKPKKKLQVMVVDDEDHVRKLITTVIKTMNCEIVAEAGNGKQAVELFHRLRPHMLLLDINMPLKSGKEALAEIKKQYPGAFVIMLTSLTDKETVEDCIQLGATGFIRKDLPIDEMRAVIKKTWTIYRQTLLNQTG